MIVLQLLRPLIFKDGLELQKIKELLSKIQHCDDNY